MGKEKLHTNHRFLDEAGDTTFYGKGKKHIVGQEGVSNCFIIGMVKFREPLEKIRNEIIALQKAISNDPFYQVSSVVKKKNNNGYFFHAKDDIPEIRKLFFDYIKTVDCSFEAVVGEKSYNLFESKHNGDEKEFYGDMLSHLIKNKLRKEEKMVLNIAERVKSTNNKTLSFALNRAKERFASSETLKRFGDRVIMDESEAMKASQVITPVVFNVQNHITEPLLNVADYFCWAVQRVFEKGETRYYDYIKEQVSLVVDLYNYANYKNWDNYYTPKKPLTAANKKSPPLH